jgi:hypothetical protein
MRKLAVLLLLVLGCLAVGAWWTAQPRTAEQAMGWCVEQRGQEVTFVRCAPRPLPGSSSYGKVVGVSPPVHRLHGGATVRPPLSTGD